MNIPIQRHLFTLALTGMRPWSAAFKRRVVRVVSICSKRWPEQRASTETKTLEERLQRTSRIRYR